MCCALLLISLFASTAHAQPQVSFYNDAPVTLAASYSDGTPLSNVIAVAVDANGNIYVTAAPNVDIIPAACASGGACPATPLSANFSYPTGVAVDASGKVYVVDSIARAVETIPATCAAGGDCTVTTLVSGFSSPYGIALGANGNIYVADSGSNSVKMIPATCATGGDCTITTLVSGIGSPRGIAVDATGKVYVADYNAGVVDMIPATCATGGDCTVTTIGSGFGQQLYGLAVDASGNIYVADYGDHTVKVMPASCATGGACTVMTLGGNNVGANYYVAVDASGNVFMTSAADNSLKELTMAAPSLDFGSTAVGSTSTQTVPITNISDQPLTLPALPPGFTYGTGNTCVAGSTLAAGASCNLVIDFTPTAPGNVTGSYALNDTQVVQLLGAGAGGAASAATPVPFDTRWLPLLGMLLAGLGAGALRRARR